MTELCEQIVALPSRSKWIQAVEISLLCPDAHSRASTLGCFALTAVSVDGPIIIAWY